ncbi:MAG: 30S ribosomal protein S21 [Candidatus Paceibacterota bacterium]|jgi:ribosomal protein S21
MISLRKKEGESVNSFLRRFSKKIYQSGVLKEAKKNQFKRRASGETQRKRSALYKLGKEKEMAKTQKMGFN